MVTRRPGEVIVVGDNEIRIIVLQVQGNTVRIGVDAPSDVKILRDELYRRDQAARAA